MATKGNLLRNHHAPSRALPNRRQDKREPLLTFLVIVGWALTFGSIGICLGLIVQTIPTIELAPQTLQHLNLAH